VEFPELALVIGALPGFGSVGGERGDDRVIPPDEADLIPVFERI